jgi:hypothetical protein
MRKEEIMKAGFSFVFALLVVLTAGCNFSGQAEDTTAQHNLTGTLDLPSVAQPTSQASTANNILVFV